MTARTPVLIAVLALAAGVAACGPSAAPEAAGDAPSVPGALAPGLLLDTAPDTPVSSDGGTDAVAPPRAGAGPGAAPAIPPRDAAPSGAPAIRGRVVAGGTDHEPLTSLQRADGPPLLLDGPLAPELRRLAGATVEVRGAVSGVARRTVHV